MAHPGEIDEQFLKDSFEKLEIFSLEQLPLDLEHSERSPIPKS
jgi:hypothetical protein